MSDKIRDFYNQLKQLETDLNIGIISVIIQDKQAPHEKYAFELNGVIDLNLIINPTYMHSDNKILREIKKLANKYNLKLEQVIVSNKRRSKSN